MGIMDSLDKIDLKKADPALMSERIENFPEMCADAYQVSQQYSIPSYYIKVKKVVLIGMGGSGAANDIVKDLVSETLSIPVESIHNYVLPGYVDAETLVIVSSYSGETEEVLSAFISAYQRGVKLIAITTGGKLKTLASKYHAPLFEFELKACPRAAFPYLFTILISVFEKLGFISDFGATFPKLISTLEEARQKYGLSSPLFSNPAKIMAQKLYGKIPIIYASEKLGSVARRIKNQINENSKNFASYEVFPELNHNAIQGLVFPANTINFILMLESNFEQERVTLRQNISAEIIRKHKIPLERLKFIGFQDRIFETLWYVFWGDYVSYYLAILHKADPSANDDITALKNRLI